MAMSTTAESLTIALEHHRAGNLSEAETLYREILQADPAHAEALHYLGLIAHQVGQHRAAAELIEQSLTLIPESAVFHSNLGLAYQALGKLEQATASFREALRLQPDYFDALNNLANALAEQGKLDEAVASYQRALALSPNIAVPHYNLAAALARLGKADEAIASYRQALALRPDYLKAHLNLGIVFLDQNKLEEAVIHFRECLRLDARCVAAHNNLGNALKRLARLDDAAASYRLALVHQPDCAEAFFNLGNVYADQKKLDEAVACFQQALRLKPDMADAMADAHESLGNVFGEQGKSSEAIASFEQAIGLRPTAWRRIALAMHLPVIYQSTHDLDTWRARLTAEIRRLREQQVIHDLADKPAPILFYLAYQGLDDRDIQREAAKLFRAPSEVRPDVRTSMSDVRCSELKHRTIRVGFISSFFKAHTIGNWMRGLIAHLSRDDFDVSVFSIGSYEDDIAEFIKKHADHFLEIPYNLAGARRLLASQSLDVLFYADIGMEATSTSLAFSRLAPVQCVTLGHPVTTGIETIDYFISAECMESAEADRHYTEKLIRLKVPPFYFYRPQLPARLRKRAYFDLRDEDHAYLCLQSPFKFHPDFDEILGGILRGDPRGILLLTHWMPWEQHLRQRFAATLPDVENRIRFLPRLHYADYLNLLAIADVQLDTLHFGGGSTSYEALAIGTPVVTLPMQFLRSRLTYAFYKQMNVLDCVAQNGQQYIDIALRLGTDRGYRQTIRDKIFAANSVLHENTAGIRELEHFLRQAVKAASEGIVLDQPP
jgi:protein O-GlcNAc transferase